MVNRLDHGAREPGVEDRQAEADHAARVSPHVRQSDDRGGREPKALQTFMGHASITVTLDRYGHLFPGSESEAAVLLDAYLAES